jgi:hypothetical protein
MDGMRRSWSRRLATLGVLAAVGCGGGVDGDSPKAAAPDSTSTTLRVASGSGEASVDLAWIPSGLVPGSATSELEGGAVVDGTQVDVPTASPGSETFDFIGPGGSIDMVVSIAPSAQWSHANMRDAIASGSQTELPLVQGRPASARVTAPDMDWSSVTVIWSDALTVFVNGRVGRVTVEDLVRVADELTVHAASES